MKLHYLSTFILLISFTGSGFASGAGCSVAGTASLQQDSICYEDTTFLQLTGYVGTIQWQSYNGSAWVNETGAGSTNDSYAVFPGQTTQYRALVTDGVCVADTSNVIELTVGVVPVPSGVGATRCGPGQVILNGTGTGTLQWYTDSAGGIIAGTGSPFNTYVPGTMTFYLENTAFGGPGNSPVKITEADLDDFNGADDFEITNVAPYDVDITGWKIAVGDDYADINIVNSNVLNLSGVMTSGQVLSWTDNASGPNYFGSNLFWTGGSSTLGGWIAIIDNNDELVEFVVWAFTATDIQNANLFINGNSYTIGTQWIGNAVDNLASSGISLVRNGNKDNNTNTDWGTASNSIGTLNPGMTVPFIGLGCSSPRTPIDVTVTTADPVNITAVPPALCQGQSAVLTATSNNAGYAYTWSPATALSDTVGATVTASPMSPIFYVAVGDDGTCSHRDTVFIDVGPASVAGTADNTIDTVCFGNPVTLTVTGSVGNIQWQSNDGSGWVDETDPGFDSITYIVTPLVDKTYRAVVTSGGCPSDTTSELDITVLTVADPLISDTTVCAPSNASFTAGGQGAMVWYNDSTGADIYNGNPFIPLITGDTMFYVASKAGTTFRFGPQNHAMGNVTQSPVPEYGLSFDVTRTCILEKIYVYPAQTGNVTINLRAIIGGPILETISLNLTSSVSKVPVMLGWQINPGVGYRLELGTGSISLRYNFTGASYPYTSPNSPVSIQGFVNPNFGTNAQYFYFYDWSVLEGCISNRVPFNVTTIPGPAIPVITQHDTTLTSSVTTDIQWSFNGNIIPGATSPTLIINQLGLYSVTASTPNGCSNTTSINVITLDIDELEAAGISVYPNPFENIININFDKAVATNSSVRIIQSTGSVVYEAIGLNTNNVSIETSHLAKGIYMIEIQLGNALYRKTMVRH